MAQFSVRIRDCKSGVERSLPSRLFADCTSRADAELSRAWYDAMSSASARKLVETFVVEEYATQRPVNTHAQLIGV